MAAGTAPGTRYALVILDGLGDRPHPETGGISPVEAAATPHLDRLLALGRAGQVSLLGPGIAPESDAGVLALLGYDPVRDSPGRGVLEAMGVELPLAPGDVALRMNFATADGDGTIVDARVGRSLSTPEGAELARLLTGADLLRDVGIRAQVRSTIGHRGVLWLHPTDDSALSAEVSNSDPFYEKVGGMGRALKPDRPKSRDVTPLTPTPEAARTAEALNRFLSDAPAVLAGSTVNAKRAMGGRPIANTVLLRNAGSLPKVPVPSFQHRTGLEGAAVTEMPVERGIARLLGLADRFVGPMGPDRDASLRERAAATREAMAAHSFTYVHLKGPDEPGHDGRANGKREVVEALDRSFFGPFLDGLDLSSVRLIVTADHSTPAILKAHSDDPVPLLLAGHGVSAETPAPRKFGESEAARGGLGTLRGSDVLDVLLGRGRFAAA